MGNVPISCCRSKSPRLNQSSDRNNTGNYRNAEYSADNSDLSQGGKFSNKSSRRTSSNNTDEHHQHKESSGGQSLQHISEREPDDSETDPSSNPLNRPIFAARSSNNKNRVNSTSYTDSYSSSNCTSTRKQSSTPLTSSQDHGYNSNTSTNLTQYDEQINDSFDSSFQKRQQQAIGDDNQIISNNDNITNKDDRLLLLNSPTNSEKTDHLSRGTRKFELSNNSLVSPNESRIKKSSSCSTIFTDGSTLSQPNLEQTIICVSLAIYYHIKNRTSDNSTEIFDETIHPLKMPSSETRVAQDELIILDVGKKLGSGDDLEGPDQKTIYSFVKTLFESAQLTSEYAITTLVYLERLMTYSEMDLTPKTWRRMFLGAIVLSSKVWEDQAVWNVDYAQILEEISVEDINELERQYLELIQFNMNVPSSVYAKYYFHLRTLALKNGLSKEQKLLTVGEAKTLEAMSRVYITDWRGLSPIHRKSAPTIKRYTSLEKLRMNGLTKAVLM